MPKDGAPESKNREKDNGHLGLQEHMGTLMRLIAETVRWVDRETYDRLPVWYPETARGQPFYNEDWTAQRQDKRTGALIFEGNMRAGATIRLALGMTTWVNWTCCHLWGSDDPSFRTKNKIVKDPRHYSCAANMVLLPTALKGATDSIDQVKRALRTCAYHLYGWMPHDDVLTADLIEQKQQIKTGPIPDYYPDDWPQSRDDKPPPGLVPINGFIENKIDVRIRALRQKLDAEQGQFPEFPRVQVRAILAEGGLHL
jgi:hypothetical protein